MCLNTQFPVWVGYEFFKRLILAGGSMLLGVGFEIVEPGITCHSLKTSLLPVYQACFTFFLPCLPHPDGLCPLWNCQPKQSFAFPVCFLFSVLSVTER